MNDRGILTTWDEIREHGGFDYPYPDRELTAVFKLDFRAWGKRKNLLCYFSSLEDDTVLLVSAWWRKIGDEHMYAPRNAGIDFAYVNDGTKWQITTKQNSKGGYTWFDAKPMYE